MHPAFKRWLIVALLALLILGTLRAGAAEVVSAPTAELAALQKKIEAVLDRMHTPGAGVALVRRDGVEWIAGIGMADVAARRPVTPDTLFRIGSTSKGFVALALLKLQEEGKLSLQDTLRSRAPDIAGENPWEETDPVRLVHLLEHTSGWDDLRLRDYASDPAQEFTLQEGLALSPVVRRSRWKPGTRFAYSNAGPAAAAYVVEQVTGQRFEDYIEKNWFRPLGMTTASYLGTPDVLGRLTKLHRPDGTTYPYWKISTRPSGAINASAREMANYVQFYLNRGAFGGVRLLPSAAIDRMERATSTVAAREGLGVGYGLGHYATMGDGWVWHGHNGGVLGGVTELAYLPEAGVGYVVMLNAGRGDALSEIARLVRAHLLRHVPAPAKPPLARVAPVIARDYAGWYEFVSPRIESLRFLQRLQTFGDVRIGETDLTWSPLRGPRQSWVAVNDRQFRRTGDTVPTLALIADRSEGMLIQTTAPVGGFTLRRVPGWWMAVQLETCAFAALLMLTTVAFALVWVPRKLLGRMRDVGHLSVRALPLFATLALAGLAACAPLSARFFDFARYGNLTAWSLAVFILSLVFPICAVAGLVQAWRHRHAGIRRAVWWHAFLASTALTIVAGYLGYWGVLGVRTWA